MFIGTDIERVDRFKKVLNNDSFLKKFFTEKEINYCFSKFAPEQHFAARFAAKESTIKAFYSLSRRFLSHKEIEILNDEDGRPFLNLRMKIKSNLSLSHTDENAIAFVCLENEK